MSDSYCPACGSYMPLTVDETRRVHCCDRTPPVGDVPVSVFVCPTCGGHGSFAFGCWGTRERPHEHVYARRVHEVARELRDLKASVEMHAREASA